MSIRWKRERGKFDAYFKHVLIDLSGVKSFENFVTWVSRIPDWLADRHYKSQTALFNGIELDFIGKLEQMDEDWEYIRSRFGLEAVNKHNASSYLNDEIELSESTKRKIRRRYKDDFERCNYQLP